jgi:plastocyanin
VRVLRIIVVVAGLALVAAGCTGTGGGGNGYGGAVAATQSPTPAPTIAPTNAPSAAASAASGGGYTRRDYGVGSGASTAPATSMAPGTVALSGYAFAPATLSVATGSSLKFTNGDSTAHAIVIGENGTPASGQTPQQVEAGQSISITFPTAGTVRLTCTIHPSMNATVTVGP